MGSKSIVLKRTEELRPQVESILLEIFERVAALLPNAEYHHIGATAIPGSVTKGDIDIQVLVSPSRFESAKEVLRKHFEIKQPKNWTSSFASFGDDATYELQVGIQLAAKDSESDFLVYLRDYLIERPEELRVYNSIKQANARFGADQYWREKDKFFAKILVPWKKAKGIPPSHSSDATRASVTSRAGHGPHPMLSRQKRR
jgi:GrpB-like predicted nucleotidyltransferase (UPF0157 family)